MGEERELKGPKKSYNIGNIGSNARVQQGENLSWIEVTDSIPDGQQIVQQFKTLFEQISQDATLDEDTRSISIKKTEAVVKGLASAQNSSKDLHHALLDSKTWFSSKASWAWDRLSTILQGDTAQRTISTIAESGIRGAIKALIGG